MEQYLPTVPPLPSRHSGAGLLAGIGDQHREQVTRQVVVETTTAATPRPADGQQAQRDSQDPLGGIIEGHPVPQFVFSALEDLLETLGVNLEQLDRRLTSTRRVKI